MLTTHPKTAEKRQVEIGEKRKRRWLQQWEKSASTWQLQFVCCFCWPTIFFSILKINCTTKQGLKQGKESKRNGEKSRKTNLKCASKNCKQQRLCLRCCLLCLLLVAMLQYGQQTHTRTLTLTQNTAHTLDTHSHVIAFFKYLLSSHSSPNLCTFNFQTTKSLY